MRRSLIILIMLAPPLGALPLYDTFEGDIAAATGADVLFIQIDPSMLATTQVIDFDLASPGYAFEIPSILDLDGASFAEHFVGQSISYFGPTGTNELLSETVEGPLQLEPGTAKTGEFPHGSNLCITNEGSTPAESALYGCIPTSVGEGAISVLFDSDQSGFSFDTTGGTGPIVLHLYRRDGNLIDSLLFLPVPGDGTEIALLRAGGIGDIAGFSLCNGDIAGLGIDNVRFGVVAAVPEPSLFILMATSFLGMLLLRRHFRLPTGGGSVRPCS